jgi:TonB family protein
MHVLAFTLASDYPLRFKGKSDLRKAEEKIIFLEVVRPPPENDRTKPERPVPAPKTAPAAVPSIQVPQASSVTTSVTKPQPAFQAAPPAPTTEEWAFAAKYTLKNSKGYRHTWGQQVRSMMGTAVEGPDQGTVRFRVEIAPDGTLANLATLWSTSTVAERLARKAIEGMPPLPPTPTGKPLIFERTISFTPFASDAPPIYRDDCLPDPPAYDNRFAWDGKSPTPRDEPMPLEKLDPQALEECLNQLPQDSIEAENAHDQRIMDRWGSSKLWR